jgi:hypothetical protein
MKAGRVILFVLLTWALSLVLLHADIGIPLYTERHDAQLSEKQGNYVKALVRFKVELALLEKLHQLNPSFESDIMIRWIGDCRNSIIRLEPLALKQFGDKNGASLTSDSCFQYLHDAALKETYALQASNMMVEYQISLEFAQQIDPKWHSDLVQSRLKDAKKEIDRLENEVIEKSQANGHTVQ